jgi:hypothetical protein
MLSLALILCLGQVGPPVPPPPPPAVKKEPEKPKIPERIRVGPQPSSGYSGPGARWDPNYHRLTTAELARHEQRVEQDPSDICARGALIAWNNYEHVQKHPRTPHILWMIEHHPDWDGFHFNEDRSFAIPRSDEEKAAFGQVTAAWKRQTSIASGSGQHWVLAGAARFLALMNPKEASALLQRAMELEPDSKVYAYSLGHVFGLAIYRSRREFVPPVQAWAEDQLFAATDKRIVLASWAAMSRNGPTPLTQRLRERMEQLPEVQAISREDWFPPQAPQIPCPALP